VTGASCLILGGKGFVGSAIVAEARARGYDVLSVDKDEYDAAIGTRCDLLINANGNSKKFLARENPALEFDLSVRSVHRALQDFKAARVVHLSTMDVYPDVAAPALNREDTPIDITRLSPYGFHKYLAEQIVRHYAGQWLIFRMAGFVGPGLWKNSIFDLLTGQPLRVHPDSEYQYLNTRDLARAIFTVAEGGATREVFNMAGDGLVSLRQVAGMIPGRTLDPACLALPRERYEMNVGKVTRICPLPRTEDTIRDFVRDWTISH
jgi:nucleoside-diphosphate-sugar epimerase